MKQVTKEWTVVAALALAAVLWFGLVDPAMKEHKAKAYIASKLLDPSSAQFRNLKRNGGSLCGEVNGKNRFGAYVGFQTFFASLDGDIGMVEPQASLLDATQPGSTERTMRLMELDVYRSRYRINCLS